MLGLGLFIFGLGVGYYYHHRPADYSREWWASAIATGIGGGVAFGNILTSFVG